jgi:hypothetical protein
MKTRPTWPVLALVLAALAVSGCATMQTRSSPREFDGAPYYATYAEFRAPDSGAVAHLPIRADAAAGIGNQRPSMLVPLLDAMNGYLDEAGWSTMLDSTPRPEREAPRAYVGRASGLTGSLADRSPAAMVLQTTRPSRRWAAQLRALADRQHAGVVLVIALGPGEYSLRQRGGLSLRKELQLGTGYTVPVAWLNAVDAPIHVLHLTGLLLSVDGKVLRAGAEGIIARQPNFVLSLIHLSNPLTDGDVASVLASLHREDLPGQPLAWQAALQNLVRTLLGEP